MVNEKSILKKVFFRNLEKMQSIIYFRSKIKFLPLKCLSVTISIFFIEIPNVTLKYY